MSQKTLEEKENLLYISLFSLLPFLFLLDFQDSLFYHFLLFRELQPLFQISWWQVVLVFLRWRLLILPSFLKDIFAGCRVLAWEFLPSLPQPQQLKIIVLFLLTSNFFWLVILITQIGFFPNRWNISPLASFMTFLLFFSPSFIPSPSLLPPSLPSAFSFIEDWLWFVLVWVSLGLSYLGFALLLESVGLCVLLHREFSSIIFQALLSPLFFLLFQFFDINVRSLTMAPQVSEALFTYFQSIFLSCSHWLISIFLY